MPHSTQTVETIELVRFGQHLNELLGSDLAFEMPDAHQRMTRCSLDEVITTFQSFFAGKSDTFKVSITYNEGRPSMMCQTIEFKKGAAT